MYTNISKIVQPQVEAVSLKEVKDFLKITNTDEDSMLISLIYAVTESVESYLNRSLITQTFELSMNCYPYLDKFRLLYGPVQSISSITSYLSNDSVSVFDSSKYYLANENTDPIVSLKYSQLWPHVVLRPTQGVKVVYVAGYGDVSDDIPSPIKHAMLLMIAHMFENREDEGLKMPNSVLSLLYPFKIIVF